MEELTNSLIIGKWGILAAVLGIACWGAYHEHRYQQMEARQRRKRKPTAKKRKT